ncbi:unnamed protein product [Moneuplotes crassus]|uniref:Uncharacterized protein n=1 Tax=Euplotes crassus TaxID=5936 RepID=A0AAD1U0W7_EUPCR|nr:unnamed protein product [Moneuplotes crassus]
MFECELRESNGNSYLNSVLQLILNLKVEEFTANLQKILSTYLLNCDEDDKTIKALNKILVDLHEKTNYYSTNSEILSATNGERNRKTLLKDEPATINTNDLYKVLVDLRDKQDLDIFDALICQISPENEEDKKEADEEEKVSSNENMCFYEYLMDKICNAWGEDSTLSDKTANDLFQMRYTECGDNIVPKFDQYSLLVDVNDLIKGVKKEGLLKPHTFRSLEQSLFKVFQKVHSQNNSVDIKQPLQDSLFSSDNYFGIDKENAGDFLTFRFKIDQLNALKVAQKNPLSEEARKINTERLLNHATMLLMLPENIYTTDFIVMKKDPYDIVIESPKAVLVGMICYGSKFDSYTTYLKFENEWRFIKDDKLKLKQVVCQVEDYSEVVREMIGNLDFPVVAVYQVVDDKEILQKDEEASKRLINYFKEQFDEEETPEDDLQESSITRSAYPKKKNEEIKENSVKLLTSEKNKTHTSEPNIDTFRTKTDSVEKKNLAGSMANLIGDDQERSDADSKSKNQEIQSRPSIGSSGCGCWCFKK